MTDPQPITPEQIAAIRDTWESCLPDDWETESYSDPLLQCVTDLFKLLQALEERDRRIAELEGLRQI